VGAHLHQLALFGAAVWPGEKFGGKSGRKVANNWSQWRPQTRARDKHLAADEGRRGPKHSWRTAQIEMISGGTIVQLCALCLALAPPKAQLEQL